MEAVIHRRKEGECMLWEGAEMEIASGSGTKGGKKGSEGQLILFCWAMFLLLDGVGKMCIIFLPLLQTFTPALMLVRAEKAAVSRLRKKYAHIRNSGALWSYNTHFSCSHSRSGWHAFGGSGGRAGAAIIRQPTEH